MEKKAHIIQFRQKYEYPENELEKLLKEIDDPEHEVTDLLFENLDYLDSSFFIGDNDDYLIFFEDNYFLIDGSEDSIDFIVARETTSLAALLANGDGENHETFAKDRKLPLVRDVEVLLSGNINIYRKSELPRLGIWAGANSLWLDARWEMINPKPNTGSYSTETWMWRQRCIRLETTLTVNRTSGSRTQ